MKFWIERASTRTGWGTNKQPHPEAQPENYMCEPTAPGRNDEAPFLGWTIELRSIAELLVLTGEVGHNIRIETEIWRAHKNRNPYPLIVIPDDSEE